MGMMGLRTSRTALAAAIGLLVTITGCTGWRRFRPP